MKKVLVFTGLFAILVSVGIYARRSSVTHVLQDQCEQAGGVFDDAASVCTLPTIDMAGTDSMDGSHGGTSEDGMMDNVGDEVGEEGAVDGMVRVTSVSFDDAGTAMTIAGEARGTWFFEASFPVELRVGTTTVATTIATAQGDWMTEEFVPFEAYLVYDAQYIGDEAKLILHKDNPSGLEEHDGEYRQDVLLGENT